MMTTYVPTTPITFILLTCILFYFLLLLTETFDCFSKICFYLYFNKKFQFFLNFIKGIFFFFFLFRIIFLLYNNIFFIRLDMHLVTPFEIDMLDSYLNRENQDQEWVDYVRATLQTAPTPRSFEVAFRSFLNIEMCSSIKEEIIDIYKSIFFARRKGCTSPSTY